MKRDPEENVKSQAILCCMNIIGRTINIFIDTAGKPGHIILKRTINDFSHFDRQIFALLKEKHSSFLYMATNYPSMCNVKCTHKSMQPCITSGILSERRIILSVNTIRIINIENTPHSFFHRGVVTAPPTLLLVKWVHDLLF